MLSKRIKSIFNPDMFQGWGKKRSYFEGWYFKLTNRDADKIFAIIPGISIDSDGRKHSFIQLLDGVNLKSEYFKYEFEEFRSSSSEFDISIAGNRFTMNSIHLDLLTLSGHLEFKDLSLWPNRMYSPGIMGPYTFVPFMECYHGIVSMNHTIEGELSLNGDRVDFTGGRGYTEKDWGKSFPEAYIWLQANHFDQPETSIKVSVAKIPWVGSSFTGFIAGFLHKGRLYEFTTYNLSKIELLSVSDTELKIEIANRRYRLDIWVERKTATLLASPESGEMSGHISESMTSAIAVKLTDSTSGSVIYSDEGINGALEISGDMELLV